MSVFVQPALQPVQPVHPAPASQCTQLLPASAPNSCSQRAQLLQPVQPTPATQPAASSCTQLLQGQAQTHLCARFAHADGGAAAVALHPADDGVAHPVAVWVYGF